MKIPTCECINQNYIPLPVLTVAIKPPSDDCEYYMAQSMVLDYCPRCGAPYKESVI